jgi:hypothetical protein
MMDFGKFNGHFVYFTAIWYILCQCGKFCGHFGIYIPVLVCCTKKNLAALFLNAYAHKDEWWILVLARVTRFGEFSTRYWATGYFCQFFENYKRSQHFWATFFPEKSNLLILAKKLGNFLADFFTNSSGHPGLGIGFKTANRKKPSAEILEAIGNVKNRRRAPSFRE